MSVSRAESWVRGVGGGTKSIIDDKYEKIDLETVSKSTDGHMSATAVYDNRSTAPFLIRGTQASDDDFYPSWIYQVANSANSSRWKTIGVSPSKGKAATLTVAPKAVSKMFFVDLDAFVAMIGKYKYGRMKLKTGESVVFELHYLLSRKD